MLEGKLSYLNGSGAIENKKRRCGAGIKLDGVWDSVIKDKVLFDNSRSELRHLVTKMASMTVALDLEV